VKASNQIPSELSHHFGINSDPLRKQQIEDMHTTEAQRRDEQGGGTGSIADKTQLNYEMQPPPHIRDPVMRDHFDAGWKQGWIAAQRDAAMRQAAEKQPEPQRQQEQPYQPTPQPHR
jgi:hypothetical protein